MNFDDQFFLFLQEYNNPSFVMLARPGQTLKEHILGMYETYLDIPAGEKTDSWLHNFHALCSLAVILSHDIGKLNPYFQYKIARSSHPAYPPIPKESVRFSFHSNLSAFFGFVFAGIICDSTPKLFSGNLISQTDSITLFKHIVSASTWSHHFSTPSHDYTTFNEIFMENKDLECYFRFLIHGIASCRNFIEDLANQLNVLQSTKIGKNITLVADSNIIEHLKTAFVEFVTRFSITDENDVDDVLYVIDDLTDILDDFDFTNPEKAALLFTTNMHVQSILCDLDIWDASFFDPASNSEHLLPFFQTPAHIDLRKVENYVSCPFGKITENFSEFVPDDDPDTIPSLRRELFKRIMNFNFQPGKIYTVTAPTGAGKTLALLEASSKLAFQYLDKFGIQPRVIYTLPFISIGSQVAKIILKINGLLRTCPDQENRADFDRILFTNPLLIVDNYLTEHAWTWNSHDKAESADPEPDLFGGKAKWMISTWSSEFIVTTFVKFFNSILKPFKQNYLRFHRIAHSIIILDEIQCLPVEYWGITRLILKQMKEILNCTIILSTATQPAIMDAGESEEIALNVLESPVNGLKSSQIGNGEHPLLSTIGTRLNRYEVIYHPIPFGLSDFHLKLREFVQLDENDVMVVLNTKKSVSKTFRFLSNDPVIAESHEIKMASTLVLPLDRHDTIEKIKDTIENIPRSKRKPILFITTQLIEAGVDITFPRVIRDFAPLDSIVQVAGRCNRHDNDPMQGKIFIVHLMDDANNNHPFFKYVYKSDIVQEITTDILRLASESNNKEARTTSFGEALVSDECTLRLRFPDYFRSILSRRVTNSLIPELKRLDYSAIAIKFDIIRELDGEVPLYIVTDNDSRDILNKMISSNCLFREFYKHSITISEKVAKKLLEQGKLKYLELGKDCYFYTLDARGSSDLYSKEFGFNASDPECHFSWLNIKKRDKN